MSWPMEDDYLNDDDDDDDDDDDHHHHNDDYDDTLYRQRPAVALRRRVECRWITD